MTHNNYIKHTVHVTQCFIKLVTSSFSLDLQLYGDRFNKLRFKLHVMEYLSETDELQT